MRLRLTLSSDEGTFSTDVVLGENELDASPDLADILEPMVRAIRSQGYRMPEANEIIECSYNRPEVK